MNKIKQSMLSTVLFSLLLLALAACQPIQQVAAPSGDAAVANQTALSEAVFIAKEYSFEGPQSLSAGWTRITLVNQGELAHDLMLFKVDDGKTIDDVMVALDAEGIPEWAEFYGVLWGTTADESGWFLTNLTPGTYVYLSFGEAEDAPPDAAQGMIATLTVTEAAEPVATEAPIAADASIELVNYQFVINGVKAGDQVLRVSNSGDETHEVVFFRLKEGKTLADFQARLALEMSDDPMPEDAEEPADDVGGIFLSPGLVNYIPQTFEAGNYIFICFLPSPAHEMKAHFDLGMIQRVTIE